MSACMCLNVKMETPGQLALFCCLLLVQIFSGSHGDGRLFGSVNQRPGNCSFFFSQREIHEMGNCGDAEDDLCRR